MTGDFVYEALVLALEQWKSTDIDDDKYNLVYDYLEEIAYNLWVDENDSPDSIVDNLIINGDYAYEWEERYERAIRNCEYTAKGDGIVLLW